MSEADAIEDQQEDAPNAGLELDLAPLRLSIGLTKVIINWQLDLRNSGDTPLLALRIWSDLVSAHGSVANSEQLRGPDIDNARLQQLRMIGPGEEERLTGEWHLPLTEVKPVQGTTTAVLLLPLARIRIVCAGLAPQRAAFLIAEPPQGSDRLRPLRLDAGPRMVTALAARQVG